MRFLVTGVSGFLGASAAHYLARHGCTVTGIARRPLNEASFPTRVHVSPNPADLGELIDGVEPDVIIHAAGSSSVGRSMSEPAADFASSVAPFLQLLEAVRLSRRRPTIVFPSSAAVYGTPDRLPIKEDDPLRPISPYGHHRVIAERLGSEFSALYGLDVLVVRLFSLFGALQRKLLVWEAFRRLVDPQPADAVFLGTGEETRDFLEVDDAIAAILALVRRDRAARAAVVNVASGVETRIADIVSLVRTAVGATKSVRFLGTTPPGDPTRWRADVSLLNELLPEFHPRGVEDTLLSCLRAWRT